MANALHRAVKEISDFVMKKNKIYIMNLCALTTRSIHMLFIPLKVD